MPAVGVNLNYSGVLGLPRVPSLAAIPDPPETAILLVGHTRLAEAFEEAAAAGVCSFVVPGLGDGAGEEGAHPAGWLARCAKELGAAVLGPNCMGVARPGETSSWISPAGARGRRADRRRRRTRRSPADARARGLCG